MASDHITESSDLFENGYNCSQAVFSVYAQEYGLDPDLARKIATGLGAGVGRTGTICGAVSGAILAIGLVHGMGKSDEVAAKEKCYALDTDFVQRFTSEFGSIECPALLGFNLSIPAEQEEARKRGVVQKICPGLVKGAVEILDEIL